MPVRKDGDSLYNEGVRTYMEYISRRLRPNDEGQVLIMPVGDVQLGVPAFNTELFKRNIDWGMRHGAWFLGMGDYVDMMSPSNRRILRQAEFYDNVTEKLRESAEKDIETFISLVEATKGRWLGCLEGHHYNTFYDGTTSDTRISKQLGTAFLGDSAIITLTGYGRGRGAVKIWCHHGEGSGSRLATPLNRLEQVAAGADADIYLMGHQHRKVAGKIDQLDSALPRGYHTKTLACTGSYLRGWLRGSTVDGRAGGTYVEQRLLNPVTLGGVVIRIHSFANERPVDTDITCQL